MGEHTGNLKVLGDFASGNIVAMFLAGDAPNYDELRIIQALDNCCALLRIGRGQEWRRNDDYNMVTATDRNLIPKHLRDVAVFVFAYAPDGAPLNGGKLRQNQLIAAYERQQFYTPDLDSVA
ncbi:MAG: hypothetical protein GC155_04710 [Alphaproteobacteria bacterium]|nr:hypothetical protein [Alphaproteobacteria bacterium]